MLKNIVFFVIAMGFIWFRANASSNPFQRLSFLRIGMDLETIEKEIGKPVLSQNNFHKFLLSDKSSFKIIAENKKLKSATLEFATPLEVSSDLFKNKKFYKHHDDATKSATATHYYYIENNTNLLWKVHFDGKVQSVSWITPPKIKDKKLETLKDLLKKEVGIKKL